MFHSFFNEVYKYALTAVAVITITAFYTSP